MAQRTKRGRPPDPAGPVARLPGDAEAKRRLAVVLATLSGARTIEEACAELDIGPSRFFELKQAALGGALAALAPRAAGRPANGATEDSREAELAARVAELEEELQCALVRTEIALVMPRLLRDPVGKKTGLARKSRRGPRPPLAAPRGAGDDDAAPAR